MTRQLLLAALASGLAFAATGCTTNEAAVEAASSGNPTPTERTAYVGMAAASDMYEIQSSELARSRAQNPAIRDFAQMLITDHSNTSRQLTAAATAAGMAPPAPALLPMQVQMINQLQAARGADFDRVYASQQVQAHQMALSLHSNYAQNGDAEPLRAVASAAVPIIQHHLDTARQLAGTS
jgi:putative membrane protein